jgi:hypothetical protein
MDWRLIAFILFVLLFLAIPRFVKAPTTSGRTAWARMTRCKSACIANLKQIDGATQQWALEKKQAGNSPVTASDVLAFLKGNVLPACPADGTYSLSTVSGAPTCSAKEPGHSL